MICTCCTIQNILNINGICCVFQDSRSMHAQTTYTDKNIEAAFRGIHVSLVKHSYAWIPRKSDYQSVTTTVWLSKCDCRTDRPRTKQSLCAAMLRSRYNHISVTHATIVVFTYSRSLLWRRGCQQKDGSTNIFHSHSSFLCITGWLFSGEIYKRMWKNIWVE